MYKTHKPKFILSMLDTGKPMYQSFDTSSHITLYCDDVLDKDAVNAPTYDMVLNYLKWGQNFTDYKAIVHCHAGISRSTAMAIGILVYNGMSIDDAIDDITTQRPGLCPNPVISGYCDDIMNLKGELYDKCEAVANYRLLTILSQKE